MNHEIKYLIGVLRSNVERRGYQLQPPCSESGIQRLVTACSDRLGGQLSVEYLNFLRLTNGFHNNSVTIFADAVSPKFPDHGRGLLLQGFIEENETYRMDREGYDQIHVYGNTELYVFGQNVKTGAFLRMAEDDQTITNYETFVSMLAVMLERFTRREQTQ